MEEIKNSPGTVEVSGGFSVLGLSFTIYYATEKTVYENKYNVFG